MQMDKGRLSSGRTCLGIGLISLSLALGCNSAFGQEQGEEAPSALEGPDLPISPPPPGSNLPVVEPIIPDDEFEDAVPELQMQGDPALDAPLESIEEFERRMAEGAAGAEPAEGIAAPLGDPALADGEAIEEIGDAPIRDAELTQPLPPLDQFEVSPVEFAEDAPADEAETEIAYAIRLEGLEEADKATGVDLRGEFKSLSALHKGDGEAANVAMVSARLEEDGQLVQTLLAAEGWYSSSVTTRIDRSDEGGKPLTAVIAVTPGIRYELSEIIIDAPPIEPPGLIRDNLALKVGEPIVAERIQGAEANVAIKLPENGYPFAKVGDRDILLDQDTGGGVYTLPVEPGPRSRFGGFATEGDLAFDVEHVEVLSRFDRGELYDSRMVDDLRKALVATGLFSTVVVEPRRTDELAGDGTEYVTVHVEQDAGPPRTIAGSAGYGTGEGITLEATWTHRNMFPPEGALIVHGVAGTKQQGAGVTFRRANAGKRDRTFELAAEALHSDFDAYNAYTGRLAAQVSRDSTPIWQKKVSYAYGIELLATAERDYNFDLGRRSRRTFYIAGLNGQLGLDLTDDLLDPTKGFRLRTVIQPEGSLESGFNPYVRARLDGSAYYSVSEDIVLAGRFRLGTIQGAERADIAPSRRLYAGGGGSVRGYGYQKLGPLDPNGDPMGGRSLNEAAAEVRYRFGNFGVVGFVDVGQSYESTIPRFSDLRYGVGIGGRYYTNFGPIRVDIATPIDRRPGEGRINVYVSIGQAF